MNLRPLGDRVVLRQLEAEETTASGIVIPGAKEKPQEALVVAVGPGKVVDGETVKVNIEVGDKVIYARYTGTEVKIGEDEYVIVSADDILAIVE